MVSYFTVLGQNLTQYGIEDEPKYRESSRSWVLKTVAPSMSPLPRKQAASYGPEEAREAGDDTDGCAEDLGS